jgi:predicted TPR repeat methyltransferase
MSSFTRKTVLTAMLVLGSPALGTARPPDLPVDTKEICAPAQAPRYIPPPPQFPLSRELEALERAAASQNIEPKKEIDARRLAEAGRMFRIGERCLRAGDVDMAVNCYQETELLCPGSGYARLAAQRRRQLQATAEPPLPRSDVIRETDADLERLNDARVMYEIGQRCERGGDLDSAQRCYEEAHRICPASRFGKEALVRVLALEKLRATEEPPVVAGEEQEVPPKSPKP